MSVDLAIVGSGAAAFAAAIAARRSGRSVTIVESGLIGGTCVNVGCIPSKALLAAAAARHAGAVADRFPGIRAAPSPVDLAALICGKDELVADLRARKYADLADSYGIEVVAGTARFVGAGPGSGPGSGGGDLWLRVEAESSEPQRIDADAYLVATGAAPWIPPIRGLDQTGYLTSTSAMELRALPESLLVIGGNAIGLEQGQMFARLGTDVTIVEARDRLAPFEEPEASEALERALVDEGVAVAVSTSVRRAQRQNGHIVATLGDRAGGTRDLSFEQILVATGRLPRTAGLGLDDVGVRLGNRGEVVVDEHLRTSNPRILAAGDVTGGPQYVYVAAAQGTAAATNALGSTPRTIDYDALPHVIFTSPAIASVGLTEAQARERGIATDARVLALEHVPRAIVDRDTRGLVKLVAEAGPDGAVGADGAAGVRSGRLIGIHVAAENAGELIAAAVYVLRNRMTVGELADTWSPYLTMSEALRLAAQSFSRDVDTLSCCAS